MSTEIDNSLLLGVDSVELTAAEGSSKPARIQILAYGGGVMRPPGFGATVIDLAGLELPGRVTLLADHRNELGAVVGSGAPRVEGGQLFITGELVREVEAAERIIKLSRGGVALSASVGVAIDDRRYVDAGKAVSANGKTVTAPKGGLLLVTAGRLIETSLTPVGADRAASVSIAAKGQNMTDTMQDERERDAAEIERKAEISQLFAKYEIDYVEGANGQPIKASSYKARAIREGFSPQRVERDLILAGLDGGPNQRMAPAIHVRPDLASTGNTGEVIEAVLLCRAGYQRVAERLLGEHILEASDRYRSCSLVDLSRLALDADGRDVPHDTPSLIKAAFSTNTMTDSLTGGIDKLAGAAFAEAPATWRSFAAVRDLSNFREHKVISPEHRGQLEKLNAQGEIVHGVLGDESTELRLDTYAKIIGLDRQHMINDDLSFLQEVGRVFSVHAMRKVSDLAWGVVLANAGSFFSVGNANAIDNSMGLTGLQAAVLAMRKQRDTEGNDLDIVPRVLAVAPELEVSARAILASSEIRDPQQSTSYATGNSLASIAKLEVESRLSNSAKFANASTTGWYLFGGPDSAPLYIGFLNGRQAPSIEFFGLSHDVKTLGISWRVFIDVGAALGRPQAAVRSTGDEMGSA